jgi:steroid delta-isomerase-like uncharacterized protein
MSSGLAIVLTKSRSEDRRGRRERRKCMSTEENKAVARRELEELYNQGGSLDAAEEIYALDFVGHEPTIGDIRGVEGAKRYAATMRLAFPDLSCTVEDQVAEADKVVTRWSAQGTHQGETEDLGPATGNRMQITGISIERFSEGRVAESWDSFDALGMMQQLGLVPEPEQAQA